MKLTLSDKELNELGRRLSVDDVDAIIAATAEQLAERSRNYNRQLMEQLKEMEKYQRANEAYLNKQRVG